MIDHHNEQQQEQDSDLDQIIQIKKQELYSALAKYSITKFNLDSKLNLSQEQLIRKIQERELDTDNETVSTFFETLEDTFLKLENFLNFARRQVDPKKESFAQLAIYFHEIKNLREEYSQAYKKTQK